MNLRTERLVEKYQLKANRLIRDWTQEDLKKQPDEKDLKKDKNGKTDRVPLISPEIKRRRKKIINQLYEDMLAEYQVFFDAYHDADTVYLVRQEPNGIIRNSGLQIILSSRPSQLIMDLEEVIFQEFPETKQDSPLDVHEKKIFTNALYEGQFPMGEEQLKNLAKILDKKVVLPEFIGSSILGPEGTYTPDGKYKPFEDKK